MRKILGSIMSLVLLAAASAPAWAQTSRGRYAGRVENGRSYNESRRDRTERYGRYDRRDDESF